MKRIFLSPERDESKGYKDYLEARYTREVSEKLKPHLERHGFEVFIAEQDMTLTNRAIWANINQIDYYLCVHTNAGVFPNSGTGAECLYFNHPESIRANQMMYNRLTELYPSARGIKDYTNLIENNMTNMVSCYPELAFHDNDKDLQFLQSSQDEIVIAMCKAVLDYFVMEYIELKPTPPITCNNTALLARIAELEQDKQACLNKIEEYEMALKIIDETLSGLAK